MPAASAAKFEQHKVQPYQLSCVRTATTGPELVFVVAQAGRIVLIFDDVEEEFGVGSISPGNVLKEWQLCGSLETALKILEESPR